MSEDRPWDESVDNPPDPQLVTMAHACFDFARAGDIERLRAYIENGVPANLTDAAGNTLLMLAAYHGHPKTVRMLVDLGADRYDLAFRAAQERLKDSSLTARKVGTMAMQRSLLQGEPDVTAALLKGEIDGLLQSVNRASNVTIANPVPMPNRAVMIGRPIARREPNASSRMKIAATMPTASLAGWVWSVNIDPPSSTVSELEFASFASARMVFARSTGTSFDCTSNKTSA